MGTIAVIQARMRSTRLPDKVMKDIGGTTMLARVVRRTQRATLLKQVIVATSNALADDAIVAECKRLGVEVFRGDEEDVLDRYYQAAQHYGADPIVRITADDPLIDPEVIDKVVRAFFNAQPDFAGNNIRYTYPVGLDVDVMTFAALERTWREAAEEYQRAHVVEYMLEHPERFRLLSVEHDGDLSDMRWTVDTPEDLAFVRAVYERLGNHNDVRWTDVLDLLEHEPHLADINRHIRPKPTEDG